MKPLLAACTLGVFAGPRIVGINVVGRASWNWPDKTKASFCVLVSVPSRTARLKARLYKPCLACVTIESKFDLLVAWKAPSFSAAVVPGGAVKLRVCKACALAAAVSDAN